MNAKKIDEFKAAIFDYPLNQCPPTDLALVFTSKSFTFSIARGNHRNLPTTVSTKQQTSINEKFFGKKLIFLCQASILTVFWKIGAHVDKSLSGSNDNSSNEIVSQASGENQSLAPWQAPRGPSCPLADCWGIIECRK